MGTLQGAIFDVDGTLVLSNDAHARAWVEAFADYEYDVPFERIRPLIGMGSDKLLAELVPGLSDQEGTGKEIAARRKEIFGTRYAPSLAPAAGSRALVQQMKRAGLRLIVASSAKPEELGTLLKAAEVEDLLTEATTSEEADESKPAPDIVEVALGKLGMSPEQVVMIGDTPYDIESAAGCNVGVIALRCGGWDDEHLARALAIYDDPADLLRHYADSPLGSTE